MLWKKKERRKKQDKQDLEALEMGRRFVKCHTPELIYTQKQTDIRRLTPTPACKERCQHAFHIRATCITARCGNGNDSRESGRVIYGKPPTVPAFIMQCSCWFFCLGSAWSGRGKFVEKQTAGEKREFHCLREPQVCQQQSDRHTCSWGPDISRSLLRFMALAHVPTLTGWLIASTKRNPPITCFLHPFVPAKHICIH